MRRGVLSAADAGLLLLVVTLTSCPPSQPHVVPDLAGLSLTAAESALADAGLEMGALEFEYSDTVPVETVINQTTAAGTVVSPGTPIGLLASAGAYQGGLTEQDIADMRAQGQAEGWTFEVGINPATAYPIEDLAGEDEALFVDAPERLFAEGESPPKAGLPAKFDWREHASLPPARNQLGCGACWAFATNGVVECLLNIRHGCTVDYSEQYLVSANNSGWGCQGGWRAYDYYCSTQTKCGRVGAVLEEDFPYQAADVAAACPYPIACRLKSWGYVSGAWPTVEQVKYAILNYGPVHVTVDADDAFSVYTGGVFSKQSSSPIKAHAVVLVGWDDFQGTNGVWFLRNSWGKWGEQGYMRIAYGAANVGKWAAYAVLGTPAVKSFSINNGASSTTSRTISLTNQCDPAPTHYMASESSTFAGAAWQEYDEARPPSFTLSAGLGAKTVWFKVKHCGCQESEPISDTIEVTETNSCGPVECPECVFYGVWEGSETSGSITVTAVLDFGPDHWSFSQHLVDTGESRPCDISWTVSGTTTVEQTLPCHQRPVWHLPISNYSYSINFIGDPERTSMGRTCAQEWFDHLDGVGYFHTSDFLFYVDENNNNMIDEGEPCPRCDVDGWTYLCPCSDPPRMAVYYYHITPHTFPYTPEFFVYAGGPNLFVSEFIKRGER